MDAYDGAIVSHFATTEKHRHVGKMLRSQVHCGLMLKLRFPLLAALKHQCVRLVCWCGISWACSSHGSQHCTGLHRNGFQAKQKHCLGVCHRLAKQSKTKNKHVCLGHTKQSDTKTETWAVPPKPQCFLHIRFRDGTGAD